MVEAPGINWTALTKASSLFISELPPQVRDTFKGLWMILKAIERAALIHAEVEMMDWPEIIDG